MTQKTMRFDSAVVAGELSETSSRLGWRIFVTILLLVLVALLSLLLQPTGSASAAPGQRPTMQSTADPLVLALYYTWFDQNSWTYERLSDLPAELYASADRGTMGRHIDQAKAAGIDAFLLAWYGPSGETNQTEANLSALLEEAAGRNFRIGILFETDSPFMGDAGTVTAALQNALNVHANHPAFLRVDGRPVIFFWRPGIYGAGTWNSIRSQVDPASSSIWVAEGVDTSLLTVFDGLFLYSNTWNPPADLTATNQKFAGLVDGMRQSTGAQRLWVATVMPGYNDVRARPGSGFSRDREGGGYYAQSWQAALASAPNWVVITSFNEWPEGTYIEPSVAYGDQYIGLTAGWSSQFKAGGATAVSAAVTPFAEPEVPTAFVQASLLNLRSGPGTGYSLMGTVPSGTALPIVGRAAGGSNWWQVTSSAGTVWVFGELVRMGGPLESVAVVETVGATAEVAGAGAESDVVAAENATPSSGTPTAIVETELLNLRAGPGTEYELVDQAAAGATLLIVGRAAGGLNWWQVSTDAGTAWVYGELVRPAGQLDSIPAVERPQ